MRLHFLKEPQHHQAPRSARRYKQVVAFPLRTLDIALEIAGRVFPQVVTGPHLPNHELAIVVSVNLQGWSIEFWLVRAILDDQQASQVRGDCASWPPRHRLG